MVRLARILRQKYRIEYGTFNIKFEPRVPIVCSYPREKRTIFK